MGNILSSSSPGTRASVMKESENISDMSESENTMDIKDEENNETDQDSLERDKEMTEFKRQLTIKREQRRLILDRHRNEKEELKTLVRRERKSKLELSEKNKMLRQLLSENNIAIPENLQQINDSSDITNAIEDMRKEFDELKTSNNKLRKDLSEANSALQAAYTDMANLSAQNTESIRQIHALKDVISISKTMISLREQQLNELKNKLSEIEQSLADREAHMLSTDLRQEYERQLENIRTLRGLYEERARLAEVTRQNLLRELEEQKSLKEIEINKCRDLINRVDELEAKIETLQNLVKEKNDNIRHCQEETNVLKSEMEVVNKLFSQVILGYKTKQDLDKLVIRLEENHGLLTHMAETENGSEASSALPKLLLELVSQIEDDEDTKEPDTKVADEAVGHPIDHTTKSTEGKATTAEEIVQNLPKVWKVLMELLSHQTVVESNCEKMGTCYKTMETKAGPVLVPSVSQTYIKLKDLIVEKLTLNREVNRMKQLNKHLECRLEKQERRLCLVTTELSKTWHVVGRLKRHHHQLHTHEKILKYELQQKRKLLNELKEELEYCREKWEQAREKNTQSEKDWRKLRNEFSNRKVKQNVASINNSGESGYSDERPSDDSSESNDECEYATEPLVKCKKKDKTSLNDGILDSSADLNLVAESEDPASDFLDVADLSLDTQDGDDNLDVSVSDSCTSDLQSKGNLLEDHEYDLVSYRVSEKVNNTFSENTTTPMSIEDENNELTTVNTNELEQQNNEITSIPLKNLTLDYSKDQDRNNQSEYKTNLQNSNDINDYNQPSCSNQFDTQFNIFESTNIEKMASSKDNNEQDSNFDPKLILENIKRQNLRLAKKDEKLKRLEEGCNDVVTSLSKTLKVGDELVKKIDPLLKSQKLEDTAGTSKSENILDTCVSEPTYCTNKLTTVFECNSSELSTSGIGECSTSLENTDENTCSVVLIRNYPQNHNDSLGDGENVEGIEDTKTAKTDTIPPQILYVENDKIFTNDDSEASTSAETNHEARFAARDLRLKRLEEQTKSLVNKVNNTNTKAVKIHYKLEELHNIYGSESSRAGTPSEDTEDKSNNSGNVSEE